MIDFTKFEIRNTQPGCYYVFDTINDILVLEISQRNRESSDRVTVYDVRNGSKVELASVLKRNFNSTNLTEIVYNALNSLICEVCHQEWGPVCDGCMDDVGDKAFLLFKQLERMTDK